MWFQLQPASPDWGAEAPSFHMKGVVAMEPQALFDLLVETECWPEFFVDMLSVEWVSAPPHRVGSERIARVKTQSVREHFTVYEPGKRWTFYVSHATLPLTTRFMEDYRFEPAEGGTLLTWTVSYEPRWWLRPLHPLLRPIFLRQFQDSFTNLQRYVKERRES